MPAKRMNENERTEERMNERNECDAEVNVVASCGFSSQFLIAYTNIYIHKTPKGRQVFSRVNYNDSEYYGYGYHCVFATHSHSPNTHRPTTIEYIYSMYNIENTLRRTGKIRRIFSANI